MGQHFGRLGAMANGRVPFDAKAAQDARKFDDEILPVAIPAGLAPEAAEKSVHITNMPSKM